jgi:phosphate transport system protein
MDRSTSKDLDLIRESVIKMGTLAEDAIRLATTAFTRHDPEMAQKVITHDSEINNCEMSIDKAIFEFVALKQPVASDLRFLFSVQKMNKDLERIGDHAVNIAQSALNYIGQGQFIPVPQITAMTSITLQMLHEAMTAFIKTDSKLALKVMEQDDQVDDLNHSVTREIIDVVKKDNATIEVALEVIRISKNLERVADLSTNIAEDVIFQTNAVDAKHHSAEDLKLEIS